jgi:hypothetical protein
MSTQAERFADCVKKITKDFKPSQLKKRSASRSASTKRFSESEKESIAIAICTKSILWPQGRTLKRFYMEGKKPVLITQARKKTRRSKPSKK